MVKVAYKKIAKIILDFVKYDFIDEMLKPSGENSENTFVDIAKTTSLHIF